MKVRLYSSRLAAETPVSLEVDRIEVDGTEVIFHGVQDKHPQRKLTELVLKFNKYDGRWKVWCARMDDETSMPLSITHWDVSTRRSHSG